MTTTMRVRLGWAVGLLVIAAMEFAGSYSGPLVPAVLGLSVVAPFAIVFLGVRLRAGSSWPALLVVALAALTAWAVLRGAVADAVPRLLTTARPITASAALLTPVAVLVVLVSAVVAACVLVPSTDDAHGPTLRVAGLIAPVLGSAVLYTGALLLSAGTSDPHGIVAACLLVVLVGGWSTPFVRGGGRAAWRPLAMAPLAAAVVVGLGAATLVPSGAFDPGKHVDPPTVSLTAASPLIQLESWSANPKAEIFRARVTGADRLHLATMSTFTGADWEVDDRYREVGLDVAPDLPAGGHRDTVTARIQVTRIGGVWLPSAGTATSTTLPGALIDSDDGTLALPAGARPGETYDLTARVDAPSDAKLATASVPENPPARYLALPNAPAGFAQYARAAVRGASTPLEEAVALESAVSTNRKLSTTAPTGSSYGRLETFLFTPAGRAGAEVGSPEQFAAAFAVLAREVGLPTRLVVGFQIPAPDSAGTSVVRGANATVWPEVYFTGLGWVPFAPTPGESGDSADPTLKDDVLQRLADRAKSGHLPTAPVVAGHPVQQQSGPGKAAAAAARRGASSVSPWLIALVVLAGVIVLLLALVLLLRLRRAARHRRLGATGAWAEFCDLLVLLGRRPAPAAAAPAVAVDFDAAYPGEGSALALARAADRSAFGPPSGPVSGSPAGSSAGEPAGASSWTDVRLLSRRARRTVPRYRRMLWPVDPRPLLRRR